MFFLNFLIVSRIPKFKLQILTSDSLSGFLNLNFHKFLKRGTFRSHLFVIVNILLLIITAKNVLKAFSALLKLEERCTRTRPMLSFIFVWPRYAEFLLVFNRRLIRVDAVINAFFIVVFRSFLLCVADQAF